eukprot:c7035_g1_i1.p1 GENE.c7035_g1_i1~~c7035_g1_i1.p1  ORF type:complete len:168 (+),score=25.83 c7035_g1_i1:1-504(+)
MRHATHLIFLNAAQLSSPTWEPMLAPVCVEPVRNVHTRFYGSRDVIFRRDVSGVSYAYRLQGVQYLQTRFIKVLVDGHAFTSRALREGISREFHVIVVPAAELGGSDTIKTMWVGVDDVVLDLQCAPSLATDSQLPFERSALQVWRGFRDPKLINEDFARCPTSDDA